MSGFIPGLERWAYDLGVKMTSKNPSDKVAIIAIDEQSIANIGRWPWPRDVQAKLIDKLAAAKAKVGRQHRLLLRAAKGSPGSRTSTRCSTSTRRPIPTRSAANVGRRLAHRRRHARRAIEPSARRSGRHRQDPRRGVRRIETATCAWPKSLKKGGATSTIPMVFGESSYAPPQGKPDKAAAGVRDEEHDRRLFPARGGGIPLRHQARSFRSKGIGTASAGIGHLTSVIDEDGATRYEPLVIDYYGQQYPSLALVLAARSLNLTAKDIKVKLGESVSVGGKTIRTDDAAQMYTYFYKDRERAQGLPPRTPSTTSTRRTGYRRASTPNKIVLIGANRRGASGASQVTPISAGMNPVQTLAHSVSSILSEHFLRRAHVGLVSRRWGAYVLDRALHHAPAAEALGGQGAR